MPRSDFLAKKNHVFWLFWSKFSKILPNSKIWRKKKKKKKKKKTVPRVMSQQDFQAVLALVTQNYFFVSLSQKFLTRKLIFCHFLKKISIYIYIYIHYSNSLKVTALDIIFWKWFTPPKPTPNSLHCPLKDLWNSPFRKIMDERYRSGCMCLVFIMISDAFTCSQIWNRTMIDNVMT